MTTRNCCKISSSFLVGWVLMSVLSFGTIHAINTYDEESNFDTYGTSSSRISHHRILQQQPTTTAPASVPAPSVAEPTGTPTASVSPTYEEKCYVCNGDANQYVSFLTVEVQFFTETVTCVGLETVGRSGLLPPSTCLVAQQSVNKTCGCQIGKPDSTNSTNVTYPTGAPSVTPQPSVNQDTPVDCYLCGSANRYIANRSAEVDILGKKVNCNDLDIAARNRYLTQPVCLVASQFVAVTCGCSDTAAPSTITTIAPTVTISPTATASPTYSNKCYICASKTKQIDTTKNETIVVKGFLQTCADAQKYALQGFVDETICAALQERVLKDKSCTCVPGTPPTAVPQPSPTTTTSAPVAAPTSSAFTLLTKSDRANFLMKLIAPIALLHLTTSKMFL